MKKGILLSMLIVSVFGFVFAGRITSWMDIDNPDGEGDYEIHTTITCGNPGTGATSGLYIKYVEVATVGSGPSLPFYGNKYDGMFNGNYVHIYGPLWPGLEKGIYCKNSENIGGCGDYKVRIACR